MLSLEFIAKSQTCMENLRSFLRECHEFSHIVIVDNAAISPVCGIKIAKFLSEISKIKILYSINVADKNAESIAKILRDLGEIRAARSDFLDGVILLNNGDYASLVALVWESLGVRVLSASHNVERIKNRLKCGISEILTQSFYDYGNFEAFLEQFLPNERSKIMPSFFPFFNAKTLESWRDNNLGIKIPRSYQISQNREIFATFKKRGNLHISMLNSNFSPLLSLL